MIRIKGYLAIDSTCPRRWCWSPGRFQHRAACVGGSRNTREISAICLRNANHGCPDPLPEAGQPQPAGQGEGT